jgi:membrane protease YdiL (CAAX protease family)
MLLAASSAENLIGAMVLGGALASWVWIGLRVGHRQPLLPYEPRRQVTWNGLDVVAIVLVYVVAQVLSIRVAMNKYGLEGDLEQIMQQPAGQVALITATIVASLITFCAAILLMVSRSGANHEDLGFGLRNAHYDVAQGLVAFFASAPAVFLIQILFVYVAKIEYDHPLIELIQKREDARTTWLAIVAAVVVAPIVEEFLIRVVLQGWLEKVEVHLTQPPTMLDPSAAADGPMSPADESERVAAGGAESLALPRIGLAGLPLGAAPILASSLVFGLMHWGHGAAPVPLFLFAIVLGFLYQRTHRIWPSMVAHFALNSVSMAVLLLSPIPGPK